jgi:signal transduction histidine kinase
MTTIPLDTELAFSIMDHQPDGLVYYVPLWNEAENNHTPADFEVSYCNKEAAIFARISKQEMIGQRASSMASTDEAVRQVLQQQLLQVYQTGKTLEHLIFNPILEKYFGILRTKLADGVLTVIKDKTAEIREQEEKDRQAALTNSILDSSINAVFACEAIRDKNGNIIDLEMKRINPAFTRMVNLTEGQVVGKRYLELFPSSLENGTFAMNCEVIETGKSLRKEVYYKGEHLDAWYDVSLSKLGRDGLVVSFADITEQKKAFLQLTQQKALLDNILQHSANGISVTEIIRNEAGEVIDGRTILANDAAVRFTGIPRELYLGKTAVELEPGIIHSPYFQLCLKTLQTGEPQFTQYHLEFTGRWLEISISKMDNDRLITIFTDVTPEKETQMKLEQSLTELKRSNENLEEFTRAASHDLKEPIRKVQFFAERLKGRLGDRLAADERDMMDRMENAAARMKLLVDDLLEYSRVNDQHALEPEPIDLNQKLKAVLSDLELLVMEKKAIIHASRLPTVKGHRRQIQQLFHNLLNNGMKYSKPDVPPVINITAKETTGADSGLPVAPQDLERRYHLIIVQDNGIGFEQEYADKIFNVFTRLHGNAEYKGTGVGLAIVRKVVENHQGYIAAESTPGAGTTFKVLLPV